ncbi:hypothetical protein PFICI_04535 [Pestalotiopsis fici W106-1]|uniref:DOMON domain-containing protein n=1 Tax=Pestalotiopsis fici (strain W106-1 / CGMCC3.15140) TaxID=1229662 RepID=W3X9E4_PESFW|nr:uncharacterized protein PFICI_04535 [Pestalotiopsis fici W106-1]ETS82659.1 hypothetical protein PFICI_04535 [Pestalotiopsis fici W106-1]
MPLELLFKALLLWLLPATVLAQIFEFTAPSKDATVDLSQTVAIEWNAGQDASYNFMNLSWHGQTADGTQFGYDLAENLTTADGRYVWDPSNTTQALNATGLVLNADDSDFYFEARLYARSPSQIVTTDGDKFKVTGYTNMKSPATRSQPMLGWAVVMGLLCLGL